jgi:hypothetical protein
LLTAQPEIDFANAADVSANAVSYNLERRPLPGLGEMPIDRQFRLRIETHGRSKNQEFRIMKYKDLEERTKIFIHRFYASWISTIYLEARNPGNSS